MKRSVVVLGCLALSLSLTGVSATEEKAGISFKRLSGEETGLTAIMTKWHDAELEAQGGKFKSHGWWPWGLTAFDFDNDGDMDLLPSHHGRPGGVILKSQFKETGKHTYVNVTADLGIEKTPGADKKPMAWDFDGDGFLDVAGFSDEGKPFSLFNEGGKKFVKIPDFTFHPISHPGKVTDLNGDGYPDLLANRRNKTYHCIYDPKARTFKKTVLKTELKAKVPQDFLDYYAELKKKKNDKGRPVNRFMGMSYKTKYDLNGDGKKDLIAAGKGAYGAQIIQRYFIADENGKFVDKTKEIGLTEVGTPIFIHDLNADGAVDLLIAVGKDAGIYLNDGKGKFKLVPGDLTPFLAKRGPYLHTAVPVDLDNDGDLDLVLSNPRLGREEVFENQGKGKFASVLKARGWDSQPIAVCDLNDDGLLDVCIGGPSKKSITLYLNQTKTENKYCDIYPRMEKPNPFAVDTKIEVYKAGEMGKDGARPLVSEMAHPDSTPVHIGFGKDETFDLRVTFPKKDPVELKGVAVKKKLKITPDGKLVELK